MPRPLLPLKNLSGPNRLFLFETIWRTIWLIQKSFKVCVNSAIIRLPCSSSTIKSQGEAPGSKPWHFLASKARDSRDREVSLLKRKRKVWYSNQVRLLTYTQSSNTTNATWSCGNTHPSIRCQLGVLCTAKKNSYNTFQLCSVSPQVPRLRKCSTSPRRRECSERPAPHRSWCFLRSPPLRGRWSEVSQTSPRRCSLKGLVDECTPPEIHQSPHEKRCSKKNFYGPWPDKWHAAENHVQFFENCFCLPQFQTNSACFTHCSSVAGGTGVRGW